MKDTDMILFKGKKYSREGFMAEFGYNEQNIDHIVDTLESKRLISVLHTDTDSAIEEFNKALALEEDALHGDRIQSEEDLRYANKLADQSESNYSVVKIPYLSFSAAEQAEAKIKKQFGLETELSRKDGKNCVILYNVPDQTFTVIERQYKIDKVIQGGVDMVQDGMNTVSNAIDYSINNIAAPVSKVAIKAVANTAKTASVLVGKTLSNVTNASAQTARDTKQALKTDPDCIMARRELIRAKDNVLNFLGKHRKSSFEITR